MSPSAGMEMVPERRPEPKLTKKQTREQEAKIKTDAEAHAKYIAEIDTKIKAEAEALKKARERAPRPPEALRGIEGIKFAEAKLKELGVIGILIGGIAKEICIKGNVDLDILSGHKDVDILIPAGFSDHKFHPQQWEGGIDWWISHDDSQAPTNGPANLIMAPDLVYSIYQNSPPGLYICSPEMLIKMEEKERSNHVDIDGTFSLHEFTKYRTEHATNRDYPGQFEFAQKPNKAIERFKNEYGIEVLGADDVHPQNHSEKWMGRIIYPFENKAKHCKSLD